MTGCRRVSGGSGGTRCRSCLLLLYALPVSRILRPTSHDLVDEDGELFLRLKRFIVTDTAGLLITVAVLAASWQDRDGGKTALLGAYLTSPVRHVFADQGFAGRFVDWAAITRLTAWWRARSCVPRRCRRSS